MYDYLKLLKYCALSYENFQPFDGSDRLISINCSNSGVQYYIRIIKDTMHITFRGTDSFKDILTDAKFSGHSPKFCNTDKRIKIHRGFLSAYLSEGIAKRIHSYITDEIKEIFICGHSYGGALSLICAYELNCYFPHINFHTIVFGCPRTGNRAFAQNFNKLLPDTVRIENGNDIITKLPPPVFGYRHVGRVIHIGSPKIPGIYSITDHSVGKYIKNLKSGHTYKTS